MKELNHSRLSGKWILTGPEQGCGDVLRGCVQSEVHTLRLEKQLLFDFHYKREKINKSQLSSQFSTCHWAKIFPPDGHEQDSLSTDTCSHLAWQVDGIKKVFN